MREASILEEKSVGRCQIVATNLAKKPSNDTGIWTCRYDGAVLRFEKPSITYFALHSCMAERVFEKIALDRLRRMPMKGYIFTIPFFVDENYLLIS